MSTLATLKSVGLAATLIGCTSALRLPRADSLPSVTVSVDATTKYQELDGFGISQAFQRAEDIFGKYGLSKANTEYVLDLLFNVEKGAGFTILRNGIGSSNTSESNYMNSIEPLSPGSPSATPNYTWDGYDSGQLQLAQEAKARGLQTLYGNAWSAPGYMKTNHDENNGGYLCGVTGESCASGDWKQAYADYLVQWTKYYGQSSLDVTHLGFLNEPQLAATYAGMLSNGTQAADFIRVLAKTIKREGVDLKMTCCDAEGWDEQEAMMAGLQEGPDPAEAYLSVVTGHGYSSPATYPLSTTKKVWMTEWADLSGNFTPYTFYKDGIEGEGMTWADNIQTALVSANVSAFLYWIGAENSTTNSGFINLINDEVVPSKRFWAFAQFSRFARPGARRIAASSSEPLLSASSFLNEGGGIVVQVINHASVDYELSLELGDSTFDKVAPHLTDNTHNLTALASVVKGSGDVFKTTIPAYSMMSFVTS